MSSTIPIEKQEGFYNQRWLQFSHANRRKLRRAAAILEALHETELTEPRILDFGCGAGWLANILGMFGPTTGVELSSAAIAEASARYRHVQFFQGNVFEWKHTGPPFDVVVSQEVLEHVEDQDGYLRLARDLLADHGSLILTTPNARAIAATYEDIRESMRDQPLENWLTVRQLRNLMEPHFTIVRLATIIPAPGNYGWQKLLGAHRLKQFMKRVGGTRMLLQAQSFFECGLHTLVVARKKS